MRADIVSAAVVNAGLKTIYMLTRDHKEEKRASNDGPGCIIDARAFYMLTLLTKYEAVTENPINPPGVLRDTLQERMERDVRLKLRADPRLGGISIDLQLTE